ncbi:MAG: DNA polymerase I [Candidatus Andersenbacteria bacterium RIFCSPHIGHO2_02_FULL_45_11]|uniref:DNA polymerase I n=1 Tax=Candidatus Andersenbacteria bacterium RIFCSPHIGHO2_12_FULL_45_11 TaxID=1797281 RepID=A0A1G1X1J4_9BACT|nr:MAG: DNA polymerase I [Candidatus Andersenbacteria bacterium RIFCSPHIGHO2_01_FULL_46_36]OGY33693.1 MAG: DNA polymerase I [Candidatus Andersenbacteria bacterium RIFCSPHIGHO2_02_FULL_45_11]OGY33879.1 MAG: DNA polymerase I [Candidatus Andersenbacteria bacterium RIFCSPHIGHO2_12_FULL_45_11]
MAKQQKLAIIDAHALIHRAYHALPPMSTPEGMPTNAAYGFTAMLLKMISQLKPTHVVAAFDMKGPTFRHEEYAEYKAHRKAPADDLIPQFELVREIVRTFSIPVLEMKGFEADDIIGTVAKRFAGVMPIVIITGDNDTLQLVTDTTSVFSLKKGITDTISYTPEVVREVWGFEPKYVPDYKGLAGDASDNIKGVAGIGAKTAKDLVSQYGSLEDIIAHMAELPSRVQKRLQGNEADAFSSRKLATIHCEVPVEFNLEDAVCKEYDMTRVRTLFQKLEFRTLLARLPQSNEGMQPTLDFGKKEAIVMPDNYAIAVSDAQQEALRRQLSGADLVSFDTETDGLGGRNSLIIGMSFAIHEKDATMRAWYVPIDTEGVRLWKDFFEDPKIHKTGHNLKYDIEVLMQSGITLQGIVFDSMLASYLLRSGSRSHGLDDLAQEKLDYTPIPITDLIGSGKNQKSMREVPLEALARYACEDAEVALRLHDLFLPELRQEKLLDVLLHIELPLFPVLAHMETTGVALDRAVLKRMSTKIEQRIFEIEQQIYSAAGETFNINSPKQLRVILFERLLLPTVGIKKTQTGYSTAADELEKLQGTHPIIPLMSEYRELSKLKNTYLDALPDLIDEKTGRIYASFNQTIAATGRLSATNPNLQNIPVRTELGREIREAFVARDGYMFVQADYSQLELRIAAHMAHDSKLLFAFRAGQDIHRATASLVFGVELADVTDDMRRQAKTLNFGVLYGMGPQSFARAASVSVEEARSFIERYKKEYSGIEAFIEQTLSSARTKGYVETMFGRRKYVPELESSNPAIRAAAERATFNFPIQGTEADILKKAMITLFAIIQEKYSQVAIVLTVHDELVCEVPEKIAKEFAGIMKDTMQGVITLDAPLIVDVGIGPNWNDIAVY